MYLNTFLSSERESEWKTSETSSFFEPGIILTNSPGEGGWGGRQLAFYCKS